MEKRICPECGEEIIGRSDKIFCCDQCRNNYNNKQNTATAYMRKENAIIKKNRRILATLNPKGKTKIHREKLLKAGFNFDYLTRIYTTKNGNTYHFCYEQGYLALEDEWYALVINRN